MKIIKNVLILTSMFVIFMTVQSSLAQQITTTDLGTLGGPHTYGRAFNDLGQVAGASAISSSMPYAYHCFLWTKETGMRDLGNLGGDSCSPWAMNNNGQIVGISSLPNSISRAFFWSEETGMVDLGFDRDFVDINDLGQAVGEAIFWTYQEGIKYLGTLGGFYTRAHAINNSGEVVGSSELNSGFSRGFRWTEEGGMENLGTSGGNYSFAVAINEVGQIAGHSATGSGYDQHAVLWTPGIGMQDLGTLGGGYSSVAVRKGLNDMGQVVGLSTTASSGTHAFLRTPEIGMRDLGTLGGDWSEAFAVNNLGQVVGYSEAANGELHAFFWSEETGMIDLNTLGGYSSIAFDINDSGQIMGNSTFSPPYETHAVLWTVNVTPPTPQEQIDSIITNLNSLVDSATLNNGQGNSLVSKLEAVKQQLDKTNIIPACNLLQAFINQVMAFMSGEEPMLTEAEGQPLIDAANSLVSELSG